MPADHPADALAIALDAALEASLSGGVWADQAPPSTDFPYGVVTDLGGSADYEAGGLTGGTVVEDTEVQVALFTKARTQARSIGRSARNWALDLELALADGSLIYLRPTTPVAVRLDLDKAPDGSDVWRADLTVQALVERTL